MEIFKYNQPAKVQKAILKLQQLIAGSSDPVLTLAMLLKNSMTKKTTKEAAIFLLGELRDRRSFDLLANLVRNSRNIELRRSAAWAIGRLPTAKVVDELTNIFSKENDRILIWESAKGLAIKRKKSPVNFLIRQLEKSTNTEKRAAAAYALGLIGSKKALVPLLNIFNSKSQPSKVRGQAAEALALLGDRKSVPSLISALKDKSTEVRFWAAYALGELGDQSAIPALKRVSAEDKSVLSGWWAIRKEAKDAIRSLLQK